MEKSERENHMDYWRQSGQSKKAYRGKHQRIWGYPCKNKRDKKIASLFSIQADKLWSFVQNKWNKRWIWVAYDSIHRLVVAHYIGGRGKRQLRSFGLEFQLHYEVVILKRMTGKLIKALFLPLNTKWEKN